MQNLGVLAPGVQEDVYTRAAVDVHALEQLDHSIAIAVVDEEGEGGNEAL